jgi:pimeloyl-ACP methyl ester carboxylesterase
MYKKHSYLISVRYRQRSDQDLLLCIHGLGGSKNIFNDVFKNSKSSTHSILAVDLLGHGKSSSPRHFSYSLKEQARILELVLKKFTFSNLHILSHSLGTAIGLFLNPGLLSPKNCFISVEGALTEEDSYIRLSLSEFKKLRYHYMPFFRIDDAPFLKTSRYLSLYQKNGRLLKAFLSLKMKKLYIHGDRYIAHSLLTILSVKKVPIRSISQAGHFSMIDNPDELYHRVLDMLENRIAT